MKQPENANAERVWLPFSAPSNAPLELLDVHIATTILPGIVPLAQTPTDFGICVESYWQHVQALPIPREHILQHPMLPRRISGQECRRTSLRTPPFVGFYPGMQQMACKIL